MTSPPIRFELRFILPCFKYCTSSNFVFSYTKLIPGVRYLFKFTKLDTNILIRPSLKSKIEYFKCRTYLSFQPSSVTSSLTTPQLTDILFKILHVRISLNFGKFGFLAVLTIMRYAFLRTWMDKETESRLHYPHRELLENSVCYTTWRWEVGDSQTQQQQQQHTHPPNGLGEVKDQNVLF